MNRNDQARRSMLSVLGAAIAAFSLRPQSAHAQSERAARTFQPARHPEDEWMDTVPGKHRTVIDCAAAGAAGTGVFYANNIFTANRNGYQLTDADVAVIVVLRHEATTFAYNDAMWASDTLAVDVPEDLDRVRQAYRARIDNAASPSID